MMIRICASCSRCVELLLDGGAEVNVRTKESRLTPLHVAARRGLEEHVELLLGHGADVLATNREGETPLNAACSGAERPSEAGRYLRVIQKLLAAGADPRTAGRKQHTPLHNACANCSSRIVKVLLQHGARADVVNCAGYTPMDCLLQVDHEDWLDSGSKRSSKGHVFFYFLLFCLSLKVVEDYPDQQPDAIAQSLLNHGAKPVSAKVRAEKSKSQSKERSLNLGCSLKLDRCVTFLSSPPDAEAVFALCCHSGSDAEHIHLHPSL